MICPDCKAAAMKVCADHHRTSNHEDDADAEIDRLRADRDSARAALMEKAKELQAAKQERDDAVRERLEAVTLLEDHCIGRDERCVVCNSWVGYDGHAKGCRVMALARGGGA